MAIFDRGFKLTFHDRVEAGRLLAAQLMAYANRTDVVVCALPRGGIPVGAEIATALNVPLTAFVVRKLGVPGEEEVAMGAITSGGIRIINQATTETLHVPEKVIDRIAYQETQELIRRERLYCRGRQIPDLKDKVVILTDDGVATGSSIMVAAQALRRQNAGWENPNDRCCKMFDTALRKREWHGRLPGTTAAARI